MVSKQWTPLVLADLLGLEPGDRVSRNVFSRRQLQCYYFDDAPQVNGVASELLYNWNHNLCGNVVITGLGNTLLSRARVHELATACARIEHQWEVDLVQSRRLREDVPNIPSQ